MRAGNVSRDKTDPVAKADLTPRDLAKFTGLVALSAIFIDTTLGHGLLWENDPYWTYWITKTFLIATIFGLGTAWLGIGIGRGAAITAVHTFVLTVYYWTFSPIGLPSSPEWLDLEHTWVTGVPVHFAVIYLGYLLSLWIWDRRASRLESGESVAAFGASALGLAIVLVAVGGLATALVSSSSLGFTWFLVRLLITCAFLIGWRAIVGRDALAAVVGGVMLALVWAAYGHFLGPTGLPDTPLRILDPSPPGAEVVWQGYRETWLLGLGLHSLLMSVILMIDSMRATQDRSVGPLAFPALLALVLVGAAILFPVLDRPTVVTVSASGPAQVEEGEWFSGNLEQANATLRVTAHDVGGRVTPLPPHDKVDLEATIETDEGTFRISADQPLVNDPAGRFTTWWGVGIDAEHHGRSGIGSDRVPPVDSPLAIFALGSVEVDGRTVATNVPIHFMTSREPMDGAEAELDVGDPDLMPIPGLPNGHLRVVWPGFTGSVPTDGHFGRYILGGLVTLIFIGAALWMVRRDPLLTT